MRLRGLALCLLFPLAMAGSSAHGQIGKPGVNEQIRIGEGAAAELRAREKVLPDDDPRVVLLRKVAGKILSSQHDKEPWEFSFDVIDSPEVNAFSLPGGPTFFFTGLLDKLKTEDELAGVLGHELTHVRQQHWAHQYAAQMNRDLLLTVGLMVLKANNDISNGIGIADDLVFNLPFSRSEEHQADEGGFDLVVAAGYNPIGMAHVFQVLKDASRGEKPAPFASDHPTDESRIQFIKDRVAASKQSFPTELPLVY